MEETNEEGGNATNARIEDTNEEGGNATNARMEYEWNTNGRNATNA